MRIAALLAALVIVATGTGCESPPVNLQTSPLAVPDQSICSPGTKLKGGGGVYVCEP